MRARLMVFVAVFLVFVTPAMASSIQYGNQGSFAADTGASLVTLPTNEVQVANFTAGGLTFSMGTSNCGLYTHGAGFNAAPFTSLSMCGVENFNIATATKYSFAMSVFQPNTTAGNGCNAVCVHDQFSVTFYLGSTEVETFTIDPTDGAVTFFGFWLDTGFNSIHVVDLADNIDNEFFGTFYTGTTPHAGDSSGVPEPTSLVLLSTGIFAAATRRRKS
jgi:hypothetical protein